MHNCGATWCETVPVHEVFYGKTTWHLDVEVFDLHGHPKAKRDYAWSHLDGKNGERERFVGVLEIHPVDSAKKSVEVQIVKDVKQARTIIDVHISTMQSTIKRMKPSHLNDASHPAMRPNGMVRPRTKRVVRNGSPTNDLVLSAYTEGNEDVFPKILQLYVRPGSIIADITYGRGVFWRKIPEGVYQLRASDIQNGVDCRNLPYQDGELDCVVFDPPYMHTPGGTAHTVHTPFESHYRNNSSGNQTESKYHEAVLDLYRDGGREAHRVLREHGVLIVKCQDEVCANRQRFTHIEIAESYKKMGFVAEDLFVVVRNNRPGVSRVVRQVHARKNHSYFLVFWKSGDSKRRWEALA